MGYTCHGWNVATCILENELGDGICIVDTFFESLKSASTAPLFGHGLSSSTQLGRTMLLYNLKVIYGMLDVHFQHGN